MQHSDTPTRHYAPLAHHVKEAEALALLNGGKLPRYRDLVRRYPTLCGAMTRDPDRFAHIPRSTVLGDQVAKAEAIAAANGGWLPAHTDLLNVDCNLAFAVYKHPDRFDHIPRAWVKRRQKRAAEYVAEAEALAKLNGGCIEITLKFQAAHSALTQFMRRCPETFAHIPRKRRKMRTLEQHVKTAERYADKNGGSLPTRCMIRKTDNSLYIAMGRRPDLFAHIPKDRARERKGVAFYVTLAEKLAKENGGAIPHFSWLVKNGTNNETNLAYVIIRRPECFQHLVQEVRNGHGKLVYLRTPPLHGRAIKKGTI